MLILAFLAAEGNGTAFSNNAVTIWYVLGIIVIIGSAATGGYKLYQRQRTKWTEEGKVREEQAHEMRENNKQLRQNTDAITRLTANLGEFATSVRSDLNGHNKRISRLEEILRDLHGGV